MTTLVNQQQVSVINPLKEAAALSTIAQLLRGLPLTISQVTTPLEYHPDPI